MPVELPAWYPALRMPSSQPAASWFHWTHLFSKVFWLLSLGSRYSARVGGTTGLLCNSGRKRVRAGWEGTAIRLMQGQLLGLLAATHSQMGIPDHLTCLLRNLYAGQEATVRTGHGTTRLVPNRKKEYVKGVYCHPTYLTYMQSTSWEMLVRMKHKLESRLLGEISITSDMQMTPPLRQRVKN